MEPLPALLVALALALVSGHASAQGGAGQPVVFKDWKLTCIDVVAPAAPPGTDAAPASDPARVCYIFSDVRNPDDNTVLAAVGMRYIGPDNKALLSFQLLPSIDPAYGLRFAVDDGPILEGDVHGCDELKCLVVGQVTDDLLRSLKAGNWLILSFKLGDQPSRLDVSLMGFTQASAELSRLQREP